MTKPFVVPTGWKRKSLGDFVSLQRGYDLPEPERRDGSVPILGSFGVTGWHDEAKAEGPGVTVGRSGASFGVVSYSECDYWPLNTALYVKDFHGNDAGFAYYLLRTFPFRQYNSGSAQPSLNRNFVHPIPILVPPLAEQRRIARLLGVLDEKIELSRRMSRALETIAQGFFNSWFVDFDPIIDNALRAGSRIPDDLVAKAEIRREVISRNTYKVPEYADIFPDKFVDCALGSVPDGWRDTTLGDLSVRVENGGTPSKTNLSYWEPAEIPWLTSGEVRASIVTRTGLMISRAGLERSSAKLWPAGTTVFALYGATAGEVTYLGIEASANQACCGLVPREGESLFLHYSAKTFAQGIASLARGSAQQNLSQSIVARTPAILPTTQLRELFQRLAQPLAVKRINATNERTLLERARDSLLPQLISGELRVPEDIEGLI